MTTGAKIAGVVGLIVATAHAAPLDWKPLPPIPDREGFAGSFAGTVGGALFVVGGANFPEKRPWEGGAKVWYDRIFLLEPGATASPAPGAGAWREAGKLPAPNGYGVSVQLDDGLLLIGGGDAKRNFSEVWLARAEGRGVNFSAWPSLPKPLAMAAGARVGQTVFVAGGLDRPDAPQAQRAFFALDLENPRGGWRELESWPGPERMLATAGASDGSFFLFSGAKLVAGADGKPSREWLPDAYRYTPGSGWKRLADLPRVAVAAPSPAAVVDGKLIVVGGDDGVQVNVAPTAHQGFPREMLVYDPKTDAWTRVGEVPFSLVTTTSVVWRGSYVIPGGEQRPGVRSPAVWAAEIK
jgi:N-acetylneuraminate epimerase